MSKCEWQSDWDADYRCVVAAEEGSKFCIFHQAGEKNIERFKQAFYCQIREDGPADERNPKYDFRGYVFPTRLSVLGAKAELILPREISGNLIMAESTVKGHAYFVGAKIEGDVDFREAAIEGDADFGEAKIEGDANFWWAKIEGDASFRDAKIGGDSNLRWAKIGDDIFFVRASIGGDFHFAEAEIQGEALCFDAVIRGHFEWSGATIGGDVSFFNARLDGGVDLSNATVKGNAEFADVSLIGKVDFTGTRIKGEATFANARIEGKVDFSSAEIKGDCVFSKAAIMGEVNFQSATIGGAGMFIGVQIEGEAWFSDSTFGGQAIFFQAKFKQEANFFHAMFGGGAIFTGAVFEGEANFHSARMELGGDFRVKEFRENVDFRGMRSEEAVYFEGVVFKKCAWFHDAQASGLSLGEGKPHLRGWGQDRSGVELHDPTTAYSFWLFASVALEREGSRREADVAHYFERIWRWKALRGVPLEEEAPKVGNRRWEKRILTVLDLLGIALILRLVHIEVAELNLSWVRQTSVRAIYTIMSVLDCVFLRWPTQYGASISRVFVTWGLLIGGFAAVYHLVGVRLFASASSGLTWPLSFGRALYFSIITFTTLGYGDIQPTPGWGSALTATEAILGGIMMALTVLVIGRKFMR